MGQLPFMRLLLVLPLLMLASLTTAHGVDNARTRETLRGLAGVIVTIDILDKELAEKRGYSDYQIKTDVELELRRNGILVVDGDSIPDDADLIPKLGILEVKIAGKKHSAGPFWALFTSVCVGQRVSPRRQPGQTFFATTWCDEVLGSGTTPSANYTRHDIADLVSAFSNAYLAMNPKSSTKP
jgi:hypothetical protein